MKSRERGTEGKEGEEGIMAKYGLLINTKNINHDY